MNPLTIIQESIRQDALYDEAIAFFKEKGKYQIYGLSTTQKAIWVGLGMKEVEKPFIVITQDQASKEQWARDLAFFAPNVQQYNFPMVDKLSFVVTARTMEIQAKSMLALSKTLQDKPSFILATIEEASQKIISPEVLIDKLIVIKTGDNIERDQLLEQLVNGGYERVQQVETRGHFAVRGDIVDIFTANRDNPVRIEFFGDEIDTIRYFDKDSQRSIENRESCQILPIKIDADENSSLLSYGAMGNIILDDPNRLQERLKGYLHEKREHEDTNFAWREFIETKSCKSIVALSFLQQKISYLKTKETIGLVAKGMASFERQIPIFIDEVKEWLKEEKSILLVMHNSQRREGLQMALDEAYIPYQYIDTITDDTKMIKGTVTIVEGLITEGFELPNSKLIVVAETNIFGQQKRKLRRKVPKGQEINYFSDLTPGDYVVHDVHGIGKYVGVKNIESHGIHRDYIEIDYAGTDRLFLPTDKLSQIQKYIGNEGETPRLHKMGGADWQRTRKKAQKSIDDLADKLVALYAEREIIEGFAFEEDQPWQQEFEDAFPYEETEDQLRAVAEIKESMEKPKPMDRLLCGDVGFGKTEVAMRAAFKAIMSGKQVAVLVPTTILAQQHFQTFSNRFRNFGVRVNVLNRFRTAGEKKEIIKGAKSGQIDILIGTHALLNKKIQFHDIGLLIVDEEQRFGVAQKEKWKEWAKNIDVLTLSATPIPRTLHMSLVGVREMSVISTPPEERLPVQTYVAEYDLNLVVEAIRREISRGGQVFFVYNRVKSIYHMGEILAKAMPGLRYTVAHGQMSGSEMENIMVDFYEGHYDVLVSTSIVETGIDVPNANTIIIYDADKMGLSQLYQMRGRVGRSHRRAYAYFLYRPDKVLSETAEKRLQAVKDFTELGSGFKLAMRDLEIRGAGSILGSKQHGNIASVGFAMYCSMLEEAIAKAKGEETVQKIMPQEIIIDLKVDAYIDDNYISDAGTKITMYQRLLRIRTKEELDDFVDELIDRFGTPTDEVDNLIRMAYIRENARNLGIHSVVLTPYFLEIVWEDDSKMAEWDMGQVEQKMWRRIKFGKGKPTTLRVDVKDQRNNMLNFTETLFKELNKK